MSRFTIRPFAVPLNIRIGQIILPDAVTVNASVALFVSLVDFRILIVFLPTISKVRLELKVKGIGV